MRLWILSDLHLEYVGLEAPLERYLRSWARTAVARMTGMGAQS